MTLAEIPTSYKKTGLPSEEADYKFETYRYYVQCFVEMINTLYPTDQALIKEISQSTKHLQGFKGYNRNWVPRFLKNAWNTEFVLNFNLVDDPELARINNQWLPIQTYYSVYSAGEAVSYLLDGNKAGSHRACLKKINNFLVNLGVMPWNLMYIGPIGKKSSEHRPKNFPPDIEVPHNLARKGISPIQMVCKCLKAEHKNRVHDEFQKKKGKFKYRFDPGNTSLLNFLYRLRIKSNYEEIDVFLTQAPDRLIMELGKNMASLGFKTLILFEIITMKKIGKSDFNSIVDEYMALNRNASALQTRRKLYSGSTP
ncbi:MAG: hypothetical protein WAU81_12620 [Candidatus Aminicenantales bacterium]